MLKKLILILIMQVFAFGANEPENWKAICHKILADTADMKFIQKDAEYQTAVGAIDKIYSFTPKDLENESNIQLIKKISKAVWFASPDTYQLLINNVKKALSLNKNKHVTESLEDLLKDLEKAERDGLLFHAVHLDSPRKFKALDYVIAAAKYPNTSEKALAILTERIKKENDTAFLQTIATALYGVQEEIQYSYLPSAAVDKMLDNVCQARTQYLEREYFDMAHTESPERNAFAKTVIEKIEKQTLKKLTPAQALTLLAAMDKDRKNIDREQGLKPEEAWWDKPMVDFLQSESKNHAKGKELALSQLTVTYQSMLNTERNGDPEDKQWALDVLKIFRSMLKDQKQQDKIREEKIAHNKKRDWKDRVKEAHRYIAEDDVDKMKLLISRLYKGQTDFHLYNLYSDRGTSLIDAAKRANAQKTLKFLQDFEKDPEKTVNP